ncbi:methyltransferase family protein [Caulifigura coniformis]|nr:isoprenylcysteine carboxylmethyltransferase family protein [Caulifigura coniformis]
MVRENSREAWILEVAGWVCFAAGALFRWWATLYIGGRKHRQLATEGPYSICRNPLYLGTFLLTLSIAFFVQSVTFAIGVLLALPIYLLITVPYEEAKLQGIFGEDFVRYRSSVPVFIPRPGLLSSPPMLSVSLDGLKGELRMCLRWIWIPILAEGVALLRTREWWPDLFLLP